MIRWTTRYTTLALMMAVMAISTGCGTVIATTPVEAVWSDDGKRQAFIGTERERQVEGGSHYRHRVYTQTPSGDDRQPLGEFFAGEFRKGQDRLYYMHNAGYIIVSSRVRYGPLGDYDFYTEHHIFDLMTGQRTLLHQSPDSVATHAVPSPSGNLIALITYTPTLTDPRQIKVAFLEKPFQNSEGAKVKATHEIELPSSGPLHFQWRSEEHVVFWRAGRGRLDARVGLQGAERLQDQPIPPCGVDSPETTSSAVDGSGRRVGPGLGMEKEPVVVLNINLRCVWNAGQATK